MAPLAPNMKSNMDMFSCVTQKKTLPSRHPLSCWVLYCYCLLMFWNGIDARWMICICFGNYETMVMKCFKVTIPIHSIHLHPSQDMRLSGRRFSSAESTHKDHNKEAKVEPYRFRQDGICSWTRHVRRCVVWAPINTLLKEELSQIYLFDLGWWWLRKTSFTCWTKACSNSNQLEPETIGLERTSYFGVTSPGWQTDWPIVTHQNLLLVSISVGEPYWWSVSPCIMQYNIYI